MTQLTFIKSDVAYDRLPDSWLPVRERPVNRIAEYGPASVSSAEALAAILQTPDSLSLATELLAKFDGLRGLARAGLAELERVDGIGRAKAAQIKAAFELGRRLLVASSPELPEVRSPADAANLIMAEMSPLEQEELWVILLNTRNRVVAVDRVYKGSLHTTVVRTSELFRNAICHNAAAVIVAHNHPSGDPSPSPEDVRLTEQCVQAGKLLDIHVLDHLVMADQRFVSLKERGLGFS